METKINFEQIYNLFSESIFDLVVFAGCASTVLGSVSRSEAVLNHIPKHANFKKTFIRSIYSKHLGERIFCVLFPFMENLFYFCNKFVSLLTCLTCIFRH